MHKKPLVTRRFPVIDAEFAECPYLDPDTHKHILNYGLSPHTAVVIEGHVEIESSYANMCEQLRQQTGQRISTVIITGNLGCDRLKIDTVEIVVNGITRCNSVENMGDAGFYLREAHVKHFVALGGHCSDLIDRLSTPVYFHLGGVIGSFVGDTTVLDMVSSADYCQRAARHISSDQLREALHPEILEHFDDDDDLREEMCEAFRGFGQVALLDVLAARANAGKPLLR
jgi:hypothetical protein